MTLESIDLIVTADAEQLDAFYLSASEEEESDIEVESLDTTLSSQPQAQEEQAESSIDDTHADTTSHDQKQEQSMEVSSLGEEEEEKTKEGEKEDDDDKEEVKSVEAVASLAS